MVDRRSPASIATPYLRRRIRPRPAAAVPAAAPAAAAAAAPAVRGLDLSHHRPGESPKVTVQPASPSVVRRPIGPQPFAAPRLDAVRELGLRDPVVRLTPLQSGIGSLIVTATRSAGWESSSRVAGTVDAAGDHAGSSVTTSGNRDLVTYVDADVIVTLRHVRELRRALFLGRAGEPIGIELFDGTTLAVSAGGHDESLALHLIRIDSLVELRAEPVPRSLTDQQVYAQFGFMMTAQVTSRNSRNR